MNNNEKQVLQDSLYGEIAYSSDDLRLYQTPEMTRLRQVSLSAVAPWLLPTSAAANKFEHSVGVAHLARIVGQKAEFKDIAKDLYFAGLAHDLGTPPFSHTSKHFQKKLFGLDHEQFIDVVLDGTDFAKEVKRQGGSLDRIARFVKGVEKPLSDIINSAIDVDNMDNTLRWAISTGVLSKKTYAPEVLAVSYAMQEDALILQGDIMQDLKAWEQVRRESYKFIYSPANLSPAVMLWQSIYFAYLENELPERYFYMTDAEAYSYLETLGNKRTSTMLARAKSWQFYGRVFTYETTKPSEKVQHIAKNPLLRGEISLSLSEALHVDPTDVCVYVSLDKGFKKIHLPIISANQEQTMHTPLKELTWMVQVYGTDRVVRKSDKVKEFIEAKLAIV